MSSSSGISSVFIIVSSFAAVVAVVAVVLSILVLVRPPTESSAAAATSGPSTSTSSSGVILFPAIVAGDPPIEGVTAFNPTFPPDSANEVVIELINKPANLDVVISDVTTVSFSHSIALKLTPGFISSKAVGSFAGFPAECRTISIPSTSIWITFYIRASFNEDTATVYWKKSVDNGRTWLSEQILFNVQGGNFGYYLALIINGSLLKVFVSGIQPSGGGTRQMISLYDAIDPQVSGFRDAVIIVPTTDQPSGYISVTQDSKLSLYLTYSSFIPTFALFSKRIFVDNSFEPSASVGDINNNGSSYLSISLDQGKTLVAGTIVVIPDGNGNKNIRIFRTDDIQQFSPVWKAVVQLEIKSTITNRPLFFAGASASVFLDLSGSINILYVQDNDTIVLYRLNSDHDTFSATIPMGIEPPAATELPSYPRMLQLKDGRYLLAFSSMQIPAVPFASPPLVQAAANTVATFFGVTQDPAKFQASDFRFVASESTLGTPPYNQGYVNIAQSDEGEVGLITYFQQTVDQWGDELRFFQIMSTDEGIDYRATLT